MPVDDCCWADSVGSASASAGGGSRSVIDSAQAAVGADLSAPVGGCASAAAANREVEPTTLVLSSATAATAGVWRKLTSTGLPIVRLGINSFDHTHHAGTSTEDRRVELKTGTIFFLDICVDCMSM